MQIYQKLSIVVCWNDWCVLWMDDYNMTVYSQLLAHIVWEFLIRVKNN